MPSEDIYPPTVTGLVKFSEDFPLRKWKVRLKRFEGLSSFVFDKTKFLKESATMSERFYCVINGIESVHTCRYCDTKVGFISFEKGYRQTCVRHVADLLRDNGRLNERTKKRAETLSKIDNDGLSGHQKIALKSANTVRSTGKIKEMQSNRMNTMLNDIDENGLNTFQRSAKNRDNVVAQRKREEHFLNKYGVVNPFQSDKIKEKVRQTNIDRYGVANPTQSHIDFDKINDAYLKSKSAYEIASELGVTPTFVYRELHERGIITPFKSSGETAVLEYIKSIIGDSEVIANTRKVIPPKEIDIYIPEHNLAIEYNGIYWHGERNGKGRNYHLNKTRLCEEKGIHLIHIFENEMFESPEIVKSRLSNLLGMSKRIYARNCEIIECGSKEATYFMNNNHIQGAVGSKVRYGLSYDGEVMAMMTFGKPRSKVDSQWELLRYCSKCGTNVVGGASKLLTHFIRKNSPNSILSYCDRRWGTGNLYEALGFIRSGQSNPNYFYFKIGENILKSRVKFQKHKLSYILESFDPSLSEWENMKANGYDRIWDCGNLVYKWCK